MKTLINAIADDEENFSYSIFATGMHTLARYGATIHEVKNCFKHVFTYLNQRLSDPMEQILSNTIAGLSRYVQEDRPDMIVIHGDRVETLAAAIVGSMQSILVTHIEGGERSGTIDELIRHSTSKLAHIHFTTNEEAKRRLIQMGENENSIFIIGSPDIDVMLSKNIPSLEKVRKRYDLEFERYAILLFHPVHFELNELEQYCSELIQALKKSEKKYIVIYPNNDQGSDKILHAYKILAKDKNFKIYPSLRFEYFLALLKNADFLIGNSSVGMHEAPIYEIPVINTGTRQNKRYTSELVINTELEKNKLIEAIELVSSWKKRKKIDNYFGTGESGKKFYNVLRNGLIWKTPLQKTFIDTRTNRSFTIDNRNKQL